MGPRQDLQRKARAEPCADPRVDLCLLFVSPCMLRPADLAAARRIGRLVPVLPLVARVGSLGMVGVWGGAAICCISQLLLPLPPVGHLLIIKCKRCDH